jgi:hypothetical protein
MDRGKYITFLVALVVGSFFLNCSTPTTKTAQNADSLSPKEETEPVEPHESDDGVEQGPAAEEAEENFYYQCFTGDNNPDLCLSIKFVNNKGTEASYNGNSEGMRLFFIKDTVINLGGPVRLVANYQELYNGKENGFYEITRAGNYTYVKYIRGKDGKEFNFSIDLDRSLEYDTYTTKPCCNKAKEAASEWEISEDGFHNLHAQTTISEALQNNWIKEGIYSSGEGDFDTYVMEDEEGNILAYVWQGKNGKIRSIDVLSNKAYIDNGIKLGSTFAELNEAYPGISANGSEIEGRVYAESANFSFLLSHREWSYNLKELDKLKTSVVEGITIRF